ncbi:hypothetical protein [Pseudoalteromonas luteoviolacea]|uniref:hypothetical protein n=1 Tax=Pseudoalteromonas luteoviolacea TaxID=43657 RepID=UPI00114EF535|nr:hypothetical protein [Pseudoalteromonas luteoviolacea]TQF70126.1 hypothetical protein FLM44_03265 [Pseudoalteromonas luteoviolacea]
MSYLINANKPISSANELQNENAQYTELAESEYQIPIVWMMFFNTDDFIETKIEYVDGQGNEHFDTISLPCTTVENAIENIKNSQVFFEKLFKEPQIALGYLDKTIELFKELDHKYLILDASEYFLMNIEKSEWSLFQKAFSRDENAKTYIFNYSGYVEGIQPYPIEEFYSDPYLNDPDRVNNSTSLNASFVDISSRIKYPFNQTEPETANTTKKVNKKWWEFWKS